MSLIGTGNPIGRPPGLGGSADASDSKDSNTLTLMRKRFEHVCQADSENRQSFIQNTRISSSNNQWDEEVKKRRGSNRPALTFNLLNLIVKQIIGDYRQNKMSIKVLPSGGPSTEEKAGILAGLIRNIETDSKADQAYTNALECAARGGFGYFRVRSVYESNDVFNQKLVIEPIHNPLTVYFDPQAKKLTREDAEYCLVTEMISKEEFRRLYPDAEEYGWDVVDINSDGMEEWGDDENIRICEYFTKERVEARLVAFDNGSVIQIDSDEELEALAQIGINPIKERMAERINIKWRKCTGSTVLEERIYKTKYIPIIPSFGEEVNVEGKVCLRSAIYYAIDAQHSYNYERSTAIENSALTAKAPWKVTQKMIEMYRDQWDNANTNPAPYLVYTPDPQVPTGPERIEPASPSMAAMQNAQTAALDVQRTTGVFDSQLGAKSNIEAGIALQEQQHQGVTSNYLYSDNLRAAIEHCGRVLIDWIPFVYDKQRIVRTINAEDDVEMQEINQRKENPLIGITEVLNDITIGEYDVIVEAGKAFASRRKEAVDGLINWAKAFPQQAPLVADQVLQNMDVPGGDVMAERIKRSLPPQVVNDPDSPEGQQATAQAQQQQQQQQQLQQQLLQSKIQVEQGKNQAQMAKASADVQRAHAEVVKAKADTIQAVAKTKEAAIDHVANVLDNTRMESGQPATTGAVQGIPSSAAPAPQMPSRKEDIDRHQLAENDRAAHQEQIKQMLTMLAQHAVIAHQKDEIGRQNMHQLISNVSEGHKAIAQHMANQNAISAAPIEAVRDKAGRVTGSRRVL